MRHRETNNLSQLPFASPWSAVGFSGGTGSGVDNFPFYYMIGTYKAIEDVVTPGFRAVVKKGGIVNNPLVTVYTSADVSTSTEAYKVVKKAGETNDLTKNWRNSMKTIQYRGTPLGHLSTSMNVSNLAKQAGTSASAGIDAATFEGGIFLAELEETLRFLRSPLKNWKTFLLDLKLRKNKTAFGRAKLLSRHVGDNWLSYRYAIRPLISDIQDALQAVRETQERHKPIRLTSRGSASGNESLTSSYEKGVSDQTCKYDVLTNRTISVRAGVLYEIQRDPDTFGFRLSEVPVYAWNAVRWSFILDWFVNVGPWIEAIAPKAGVKVLASWTTTAIESTTSCSSYWNKGGNYATGRPRIITSNASTTENLVTREKSRSPGISVGLTFTSQPFAGLRGIARTTDLLAITQGILASK